jgi:hypothetical protein
VTTWQTVFLGVAAFSLLTSALLHVAVIVALMRSVSIARREYAELKAQLEPLVDQLHSITHSLSQTVDVAVTQVRRVEALVTEAVDRVATIRNGVRATVGAVSSQPVLRGVIAALGWGWRSAAR